MELPDEPIELSENEQKAIALDLILDAWDAAITKGVGPEVLSAVALFAALSDLVETHGQDVIAEFCADLPGRVRAGEFSLADRLGQEGD